MRWLESGCAAAIWLAGASPALAFRIVDVADYATINPVTGHAFGENGYSQPTTDGKTVAFAYAGNVFTVAIDGSALRPIAAGGVTRVPGGSGTFTNLNFAGGPRLDGGEVIFTGQDSAGTGDYGYFSSDVSGATLRAVYAPAAASNPIQYDNGAYFWAEGGKIVFAGKAGATTAGNWEIDRAGHLVTRLVPNGTDQCSGTSTGIFPIQLWSEPFTDGTNLLEVGANIFGYSLLQGNHIAGFTVAGPSPPTPGPCVVKYYDSGVLPGQPQGGGYSPAYANLVGEDGAAYVLGIASNGNTMPANGGAANTYGGIFRIDGKTLGTTIILNNVDPLPLPGFRNPDGSRVQPFHLGIQSFSARAGRLVVAVNNNGNWSSGGPPGGYAAALYAYRHGRFTRIVGSGDTLANGFIVGLHLGVQPYALSLDGHCAFSLEATQNLDYGFYWGTFVTRLP